MSIEKRLTVSYKHTAKNEGFAKNKNQEALHNFRKEDIHLAFVDADEQLAQLAQNIDELSNVRRFITIQEIRQRLHWLCNLWLYQSDTRTFASHEPGDLTPLNSEGCC